MTLIPENIIKEAIEKGGMIVRTTLLCGPGSVEGDKAVVRKPRDADGWESAGYIPLSELASPTTVLSPNFWQALGRARGWKKECCLLCGGTEAQSHKFNDDWDSSCKTCGAEWMSRAEFPDEGYVVEQRTVFYLRFCELLAYSPTQEAIDAFWRGLP